MEIFLQLLLVACATVKSISCQSHKQSVDQAVKNKANGENIVHKNFQSLFDSIAKNDYRNSEIYREVLKREVSRERNAFDTMKENLQMTRNRNYNKRRNDNARGDSRTIIATKRETNETDDYGRDVSESEMEVDYEQYKDSSEEKKFKTEIEPIVPNINNTKAMTALQRLWVSQRKFFDKAKLATEELCNKTEQNMEMMIYLFKEIDPLLERQIRVLTTLPWQNTDEMYETLDDNLIIQQQRSWDALGRCLTDHFEFPDDKEEETNLRKLYVKARDNLLKRRDEIRNLAKKPQAEKKTSTPK